MVLLTDWKMDRAYKSTKMVIASRAFSNKERKIGSSWILDSGCTNHMTGEKTMFSSYEKNQDPQRAITFGDGNQGLVKGLGKIAISPDHSISNVFLVDCLDYNLLFVSQLCNGLQLSIY